MYNSKWDGREEDLTQLAVILLCDDSTGCDEKDDYFATEVDTMIDIVRDVDLNKYFFLNIYIYQKHLLNCLL